MIVLFIEHYDKDPYTWGPQGVESDVWRSLWLQRRNTYIGVGIGSFISAIALGIAALILRNRKPRLP
jgi:hypothetical protein